MTDTRPDPDQMLARLKLEDAQAQRGKLKIFFGASVGVGKTYAMPSAARSAKQQGVDLIIGVIETRVTVARAALRQPAANVAWPNRVSEPSGGCHDCIHDGHDQHNEADRPPIVRRGALLFLDSCRLFHSGMVPREPHFAQSSERGMSLGQGAAWLAETGLE